VLQPVAGEQGVPPGFQPEVPNYLVYAILTTIFCCMPFGVVAIVYAAQVNGLLTGGNYAGALHASGKARTWCWVALFCGLVPGLIWLLMVGVFGVFSWHTSLR